MHISIITKYNLNQRYISELQQSIATSKLVLASFKQESNLNVNGNKPQIINSKISYLYLIEISN